jgi:hypothetical protein
MVTATSHARRRYGRVAAAVALVGALVYGVVRAADEFGRALHTVVAADVGRVLVAAAFEICSYVFLAAALRRLASGRALGRADAFRVGMISCGLGNVLPAAPVEGMLLAAQELKAKGLSRRRTFVAVGLVQWYFARALFAVAALAALSVAAFSSVHSSAPETSLPVLVAAGVALGAIFVATGLVVAHAGVLEKVADVARRMPLVRARADEIRASCEAWAHEIRDAIGARGSRLRLVALAVGATAADGACFVLALRATGVHGATTLLVLAYAVAMLGAFIPLLPAGLGVVETAVPAFLYHAHVPIAAALAGVLVYRVIATLMPAFVGLGALGELRLRRFTRSRRTQSARPARSTRSR